MAIEYCNLTSDLLDSYSSLNEFRRFVPLTGFIKTATSNVWELRNSGYVEMIFEDRQPMTRITDNDNSPAAGEWSYHPSSDKIRIHFSGDKNPTAVKIEKGLDWKNFLERMRNDAQEELEDKLSSLFVVPFQKIVDPFVSYNTREYDAPLRRAVADLTISNVIAAIEPENSLVQYFRRRVDLPITDPNFKGEKGFIQRVLEGEIALRIQRTARQAGGWDVIVNDGNTQGVFLRLSGRYTGTEAQVWRVEIDTAGIPGTATYKIRFADTLAFEKTLQETRKTDSENRRVLLRDGVFAEFLVTGAAQFATGDLWDIYLYPASDPVQEQVGGRIYFFQ